MLIRRFALVGLVGVASACSGASDTAPRSSTAPLTDAGSADALATVGIDDVIELEPGALVDGTLTVDGAQIDYVAVAPAGFEVGDTAPVLLAFPPGGQDIDTTRSVAEQTYLTEATERGWVVFSPASPVGGDLWFGESSRLVPAVMDWIETWVIPEGGSVHVAGVSNGGLSTFAAAALVPDRVQSLLTFPGFPRDQAARAALPELADVPVRMFVGETDTSWAEPMQETADVLDELGGDITFEIVPGEGHIIGALRDGVRIFDELDAVRNR